MLSAGHVDLVKNLILVVIVLVIGYIVGFRFENDLFLALWIMLLVLAFAYALSWVSACIGLVPEAVEAVQAASFTWIVPVVFVRRVRAGGRGGAVHAGRRAW